MAVDIEGRLDLRVAHEGLDGLGVGSGVDQQRSEGVAALVQRERLKQLRLAPGRVGFLALPVIESGPGPPGSVVDGGRDERCAGRPAEYEVRPTPAGPLQLRFEDKQELYAAASRSRGETRLYATPEVQAHREEIAPASPYLREGIPHIAEAAERDRAQLAAHDIAQLESLPTEELVRRRDELSLRAADEERMAGGRELPAGEHMARAELGTVEGLLAERRELAVTAARVSPPPYVKAELGERPGETAKAKAWDRGVAHIERYRQANGIKDRHRAFGERPKQGAERARREQAMRRLRLVQRTLGKDNPAVRARVVGPRMRPPRDEPFIATGTDRLRIGAIPFGHDDPREGPSHAR
jgi:hypothetical protein